MRVKNRTARTGAGKLSRAWLFCCTLTVGIAAQAAPILSVDGAVDGTDDFFGGDVFGFSFQLDQDVSNVAIEAAVTCTNCTGRVFLTDHLADTSRLTLLGFNPFTGLNSTLGTQQSLFNGIDLVANLYFVIFQLDQGSSPAAMLTSSNPTISGAASAQRGFDFQANLPDLSFAPHSMGIRILNQGGAFLYRVTGDIDGSAAPVQEPRPFLALVGGMALVLLRRHKKVNG